MNKSRYRIIELILAAAASALALTACNSAGDDVYWEDTLPSAAVRTTAEILVITEETTPPMSIEVPATTTAVPVTKDTELATTTTTVTTTTVTTTVPSVPSETSDSGISTVSGVPTVILPEFTTTTTTGAVVTKVTTGGGEESTSESKDGTSMSEGTVTAEESSVSSETGTSASESTGTSQSSASDGTGSPVSESTEKLTAENSGTSDENKPYIFNDPIQSPYCYTTLKGDRKKAYELMIKAIKKHDSKITFPDSISISAEDYCELYQMIYNSEHNIFYIDTQMKYTTNVKTNRIVSAELCYIYTADETAAMQKKIDAGASKIKKKISDKMTEYEIVKLFFDELASGCVYDMEASNCRDIYGCLVNSEAVCGGYAKAFSYLCDSVGISSLTITGDFEEVPHMWNMVKVGGEWYHIDVTAGVVSNAEHPYIRYDYFCVPDEIALSTHTVYEQPYTYPDAKTDKYNYYVYNNLVADSVEAAEKLVTDKIIAAAEKGESVIQIACSSDEVFEDVVYRFFDRSQARALTIYENAYEKAAKKYNRESIVYNQEKETRVIKLFLDYLD